MFIDRNITKAIRRSEERSISRRVYLYLSSAPPNVAGGFLSSQSINMPTPNGVDTEHIQKRSEISNQDTTNWTVCS